MSQEKVDAYKKEKANRRKAIEKKKKQAIMYKVLGALCGALVLVWVVCSVGWSYLGWTSPFAEKATTRVYTEKELSSIRDKLGLDENGEQKTTTEAATTTASDDKENDETTTVEETTEGKEETTTSK